MWSSIVRRSKDAKSDEEQSASRLRAIAHDYLCALCCVLLNRWVQYTRKVPLMHT